MMKTKKTFPTRRSAAIHRITRNVAASDRRRRLGLWQFYQSREPLAPQKADIVTSRTEVSSR